MCSVIYTFKRRQCPHLHFKDFNVFSHLHFQKTTMSSFTFQKTSMSSVIYAFKRRQCLQLHFKDFNVFSHLRFQKTTMSSFTFQKTSISSIIYAFKRWQYLHVLFKDFNIFCLLLDSMSLFVFHRTWRPLFLCFEKKERKKKNSRCLPLYRISMSSCFLGYHPTRPSLASRIARSLKQN